MSLLENLQQETIDRLPLREPVVVEPRTVVRAAVEKMRARQLGCAVIVDSAGAPVGVFTERSLLAVLFDDASLDKSYVDDFADPECLTLKKSEPIARVWEAVVRNGVRFICVTDADGRLVGLTGQRGLAEYVSEHFPQLVMAQRLGGKPWMDEREGG